MAETIGTQGLLEAKLIIPQGTTFACAIEHTDMEGTAIDHTGWVGHMSILDRSKTRYILDDCVSFSGSDVLIEIPPSMTATLPIGGGSFDVMLEDDHGDVVRLLYGTTTVYDTYAMD